MANEPSGTPAGRDRAERDLPLPEPGNRPKTEPGNDPLPPAADRPPRRREGVVSNPDF